MEEQCSLCENLADELDIKDNESGEIFTVHVCDECLVECENDAWAMSNFIQSKLDILRHYN